MIPTSNRAPVDDPLFIFDGGVVRAPVATLSPLSFLPSFLPFSPSFPFSSVFLPLSLALPRLVPSRSPSPTAPYCVTYAQTVLASFDDYFLALFFSDNGRTTRVAILLDLLPSFELSILRLSPVRHHCDRSINHSKYRCQPRGRLFRSILLFALSRKCYRENKTRNLLRSSVLRFDFEYFRTVRNDSPSNEETSFDKFHRENIFTQVYSIFRQNARVNFIPKQASTIVTRKGARARITRDSFV